MFCNKCGSQNPDYASNCTHCGAPLNATAPAPGYGYQPPVVPGKGMGIAGMVLGIIALVFFCSWMISIPCAIIGLALSATGANKAKAAGLKNGMATAGITMCCISLGLAIVYLVFLGSVMAELGIL